MNSLKDRLLAEVRKGKQTFSSSKFVSLFNACYVYYNVNERQILPTRRTNEYKEE